LPDSRILLVSFDLTNSVLLEVFTNHYGLVDTNVLAGPFSGQLSNRGGRITLEKSQAPDAVDEGISWIIVDEVVYSAADPWMPSADGTGYSLHRTDPSASAADPASWISAVPSPTSDQLLMPDLLMGNYSFTNGAIHYLALTFNLLPGIDYSLECSTNLTDGAWESFALTNRYGIDIQLTGATNQCEFFRLKREQP
jgi:hypothetical protein